ncbi:hypothetical protein ACFWIN_29275 [Streptomyces sp. NPDC127049]
MAVQLGLAVPTVTMPPFGAEPMFDPAVPGNDPLTAESASFADRRPMHL